MAEPRTPTIWHALIPILFLVGMLIVNVLYVYGDDSLSGANQMTLLLSAAVAALVAASLGYKWKPILEGVVKSISSALSAIIILLLIGSLAGTWLLSGVVPAMIYYGLDILNPTIFLFATCIICSIVSLATGSSWSTVATVGIALLGIGKALGLDSGIIAGAIISGAYFGDKMSPLSDTTNLAPAMAGTDLFTHIKYMAQTTVPSITITLIIFLVIGFIDSGDGNVEGAQELQASIAEKFTINGWLFIVPLAVIGLIVMRVPAIPALLVGTLLGGIFAVLFQPHIIQEVGHRYNLEIVGAAKGSETKWNVNKKTNVGEGTYEATHIVGGDTIVKQVIVPAYSSAVPSIIEVPLSNGAKAAASRVPYFTASYIAAMEAMTREVNLYTGNDKLDGLLSTGGMYGMLNTIWLILCAMCFGGVMEATGMLKRLTQSMLMMAKSTGSLIATTAASCVTFNLTASDQYLSIVVPGRMFAEEYAERDLHPKVLSRTLEDSGTVTSALVPWNTCGAYHSGVLGVATGDYWMYAFFNLISPVMTMIFGFAGIKIAKLVSD